ncbi:MAG: hypothetical protein GTO18_17430, partial [Anaerolineales bacterium]|nr:hypothetical protein [Anaerolineales bacterium]
PHNTLRLITGTFFGIVVASFTFTVVNQSLWYEPERKPALRSLGDLTILLAIGVGIVLAVLSDNPLILYPLAVMSTIGVLALLTVVYSMLLLIILRRENRARRMRDLAFIFIAGLTLAVAQIALIDFLRYAVVGTWEGFHF